MIKAAPGQNRSEQKSVEGEGLEEVEHDAALGQNRCEQEI